MSDRLYLIPAGLAGVLVVFGGVMIGVGTHLSSQWKDSQSWPSTDGVVVTNFVGPSSVRDAKTGHTYERTGRLLDYDYEVDGRKYTGHVIGFGTLDETKVQPFEEGARVKVFYDPEDPSKAALTVDVGDISAPFFWVGVGVIVLGAPFGYLAWRIARASKGE